MMAQDYDVVLKLLFRSKSSPAVREIAGGPVKRWLDKELPTIRNTRADLVGETSGGDIVHLEFMSKNQNLFELRMAGYYVEIYHAKGMHPYQVLIYVGQEKLRMGGYFKSPTLSFQFRVVDLGEIDGERFLDQLLCWRPDPFGADTLEESKAGDSPDFGDDHYTGCKIPRGGARPIDGNLWVTGHRDRS